MKMGAVVMKIRRTSVSFICVVVAFLCTACTKIGTDNSSKSHKTQIIISHALEENEKDKNSHKSDAKVFTLSDNIVKESDVVTKNAVTSGYKKINSKEKVKIYSGTGVAVVGNTAYEQYNYVDSEAKKYIDTVNKIAKGLDKDIKVYDMIIPTSIAITLPDDKYDKVNSSDQVKAVKKMYKRLSERVAAVGIYDELMKHRTEYIYFRTDHHWTSRGAYYAYNVFCGLKGMVPNAIDTYKTGSFGTFKGSFYGSTNNWTGLKADKLLALYPVNNDNISIEYTEESGQVLKGHVIEDASSFGTDLKYCAFIDGDNPYTVVTNSTIHDKSSCIVIKESFGNAFVPFLADHYSKIYVVDYRYWQGNVTKLASEKNVDDVIFCNNISMTRNAYLIGKLAQLAEG